MALRIRATGEIVCAALHPEQAGDQYVHDGAHYELSVVHKVLVTEPLEQHLLRGQWWFRGEVPAEVEVDSFYTS